jgi:hypothetical protein
MTVVCERTPTHNATRRREDFNFTVNIQPGRIYVGHEAAKVMFVAEYFLHPDAQQLDSDIALLKVC